MKRIAMIYEGVIVNVATWDSESAWNPGDEYTLIDITGMPEVARWWLYNGTDFIDPNSL